VARQQLLAGGSGDCSIQLRPDDGSACPSAAGLASGSGAVEVFMQCWIFNYVILAFSHFQPIFM
jgi:hypothetical protein